jgi:hypothetical protein
MGVVCAVCGASVTPYDEARYYCKFCKINECQAHGEFHVHVDNELALKRLKTELLKRELEQLERLRTENCSCGCHSDFGTGSGYYHCFGVCCSEPNVRKSRGCFGREY